MAVQFVATPASTLPRGRQRRGRFGAAPAHLVAGLLVAVVLPALIRWPDTTLQLTADSLHNALFATTGAVLIGYGVSRKLAVFPGLRAFTFILPAFAGSYGLMAVVLLLTRHHYSRYQLIASFLVALAFFHWSFFAESRATRLRLAVLAGGNAERLLEHDRVDWRIWRSASELPEGYDGLVADMRADRGEHWKAFLARCALAGIPVYDAKRIHESLTGKVAVEQMSLDSDGSLIPASLFARLKHAFDVLAALLILPVAIPVCALLSVLIKLDSAGPVLFTQPRVGYRGAVFTIYKLRTMYSVQAPEVRRSFTQDSDPRVTRIGRFLRRYRLDELPQIINILKGEMSWIGPRPESLPLSSWYSRQIPFYGYRHIVRPGITGWAQVQQGYAAEVDSVADKLQYDFFYIRQLSPWLDLLIVMRTVGTVFSGFGAR